MMNMAYYKVVDLFGKEEVGLVTNKNNRVQTSLTDYEAFVEKFKPKKTTDDCYTPPQVFDTILRYISGNCDLSGYNIVRPFYPGGEYENIEYGCNDVVIDNPPFSIVSQIARFYIKKGVKFFIFAPHLTLFSSDLDCTYIVCGASIIYENGANVKTSFLSNLFGDLKILGAPRLYESLSNKDNAELPKYLYPNNVLTVSSVSKVVERGINFSVSKKHIKHIRGLEDQKKHGKALFGSGFLLSEKAAAEKAAAEKAAAEKAAAKKAAAEKAAAEKVNRMIWKLSDKELKIISELG
jgi:hypothetical protein